MAVLEKFGSFDDTTRVAPTLSAALTTLLPEATPTIRDVVRLFKDEEYRSLLIDKSDNPAIEDFWETYEKKPGSFFQAVDAVCRRAGDFYGNPFLYPIMCHPDPLDLASLIAENKIILVSVHIDETKVAPREQRLLGATLVSQFQMAIMSGAQISTQPFHLYIDEAEHFTTTA